MRLGWLATLLCIASQTATSFSFFSMSTLRSHALTLRSIQSPHQRKIGSRSQSAVTRLWIRKDWYKQARDNEMVFVDFEAGEDVREKMQRAIETAGMSVSVDDMLLPTEPSSKDFPRRIGSPMVDPQSFNRGEEFGRNSLRRISEIYYFSIPYLADFVCTLGAATPLNADRPIAEYLSGEQMYSLLHALSTLSPQEANEKFCDGAATLFAIAKDCDISLEFLTKHCEEMDVKVPLPFGARSVLHASLVSKIVSEIRTMRSYNGFDSVPRFRSAWSKDDPIEDSDKDDEQSQDEDYVHDEEGEREVRDILVRKAKDSAEGVQPNGERDEERFFRDENYEGGDNDNEEQEQEEYDDEYETENNEDYGDDLENNDSL